MPTHCRGNRNQRRRTALGRNGKFTARAVETGQSPQEVGSESDASDTSAEGNGKGAGTACGTPLSQSGGQHVRRLENGASHLKGGDRFARRGDVENEKVLEENHIFETNVAPAALKLSTNVQSRRDRQRSLIRLPSLSAIARQSRHHFCCEMAPCIKSSAAVQRKYWPYALLAGLCTQLAARPDAEAAHCA